MTSAGWVAIRTRDGANVIPIIDLIPHELNDTCACLPLTEPVKRDNGSFGYVVIHSAWDGRPE